MRNEIDSPARTTATWPERLSFAWRYLGVLAVSNLAWEFTHMPLYQVWRTGTSAEIIFNGIHCTIGDVMIAASSLAIGGLIAGGKPWPRHRRRVVAGATMLAGIGYTAFSEWLNVSVRNSWAYSDLMPLVPGTGLGLSPLVQWIALPLLGFVIAYRSAGRNITKE